jgi:hypothetical protein
MESIICQRCGHPAGDHCNGGKLHGSLKEVGKMLENPLVTRCATRHCDHPLCSCVELVESEVAS